MDRLRAYHLAERAIALLDAADGTLTLAALGQRLGTNPFSVQKAFRQAAGLSPQQFQALLTVHRASDVLQHDDVLAASLAAGASGPGRLHDRFVRVEGLSPGEWRGSGRGLEVHHGVGLGPLGRMEAVWTGRGLHRLAFAVDEGRQVDAFRARWPEARLIHDPAATQDLLDRVFAASSAPFTVAACATPFQIAVWRALVEVPPGATITYGALAVAAGHPGASRAVGTAMAANPVAVLIPCHRVIRATGVLGNYGWGPVRKYCLIAQERARQTLP